MFFTQNQHTQKDFLTYTFDSVPIASDCNYKLGKVLENTTIKAKFEMTAASKLEFESPAAVLLSDDTPPINVKCNMKVKELFA